MRRLTLLLSLPIAVLLGPSSAHAKKYTLEEILNKVTVDYPGVLAARHAVRSSETLVSQAKYNWMPQGDVSFFLTGNYDACKDTTNVGSATYNLAADCSLDTRGVFEKINGAAYGFDFNILQPIYTFGKIESATKAARAGVQASKEYLEVAKQDVVYNAIRAYWGLKWARAAKEIVDEGITKLTEWIDKITEEMEGANKGNYTEADLARMKTALDNTELIRNDIQRGLTVAQVGLRVLTEDADADVDDDELKVVSMMSEPLEYFQEAARSHRPEAKLLTTAITAAHHLKNWKIAELLPSLGLRITSSYRNYIATPGGLSALVQFSPLSNGIPVPMLVLNQPLDFGVRATRYQQASAEEKAAEERRRQAMGGIAVEVATAYTNYSEARTRELKLAHAEKVARGWYGIVDRNMAQGLTASTDARELTDAARTYFDFRIRHLQAIMDTNLTLAWLKRTTGLK